jgi:hypothetical protein
LSRLHAHLCKKPYTNGTHWLHSTPMNS